ncbi:MAG: Lsr2 family protein [Propionibacteriaceae bacterium]|jgi:hypothetical protein|nr:Lsr2 family protein [Propionibacteriaceae bacterium]
MAQRTRVELIDDLDGSAADTTITFGYEGKNYEIDLTAAHAAELASVLEPYIKVGRKVGQMAGVRRTYNRVQLSAPQDVIRAWAKSKGLKIADRGRIPSEIVKAYEEAH